MSKDKSEPWLKKFEGKTVDRIRVWEHGTYKYTGYIIYFTDGTLLRLRGNSSCDIELYDREEK